MGRLQEKRWVVPAVLVVATFGSPACGDDDGGDGDGDSGAPTTSADDGAAPTECFDIPDMADCEAETRFQCRWDAVDENSCVPDCPAYDDEASCNMDIFCAWDGTMCIDGAI